MTYPQKTVVVNNYHYFYIYIFRVNHKTFDILELPNKHLKPEMFCLLRTKNPGRLLTFVFGDD